MRNIIYILVLLIGVWGNSQAPQPTGTRYPNATNQGDTISVNTKVPLFNNGNVLKDYFTIADLSGLISQPLEWGNITGALSDQTDLQTVLNLKANTADLAPVATSNSYTDLDDKPIFKVVQNEYANISALYAGQASQTATFIQYVLDATGFPTVSSGAKYFEYLGTTNGNATDYRLLSDTEASTVANIISNVPYNATTWNNNLEGASKNAIRDKFESMPRTLQQITDIGKVTNDTIEVEGVKYNNLRNNGFNATVLGTTTGDIRPIVIDETNGNLYAATWANPSTIWKVEPNGTTSVLATIGNNPTKLFIHEGNLYVVNYGGANISKIVLSDGTATTFATVGNGPSGITVDDDGNFYVTNRNSNNVSKITPSGTVTTLGTTGTQPRAIRYYDGNLYMANGGSDNMTKMTLAGTSSVFASTGDNPYDFVIDSEGYFYVINQDSNNISKISPTGDSSEIFATLPSATRTIQFYKGNIYTSSPRTVSKITLDGDYSLVSSFSPLAWDTYIYEDNIYQGYGVGGILKRGVPYSEFLGLDPNGHTILKPLGDIGLLPWGGEEGQVLTKIDSKNYNVEWQTPSGGGGGATNAENVIVSPSIGGNTDAYAVMDDHEDRIDALESASSGSGINTAFRSVTSTAGVFTEAYNQAQPNLQLTLTENTEITITSAVNGDFVILEVYNSHASNSYALNLNGTNEDLLSNIQAGERAYFTMITNAGNQVAWLRSYEDGKADRVKSTTGTGVTTIDWSVSPYWDFTHGAMNDTLIFIAPKSSKPLRLTRKQDATGSRTLAYASDIDVAGGTLPTLTTTANATDVINLFYDKENDRYRIEDVELNLQAVAGTPPNDTPPEPTYTIVRRVNAGINTAITATDGEINWQAGLNNGANGPTDQLQVNIGTNHITTSVTWTRHSSIPSGLPSADYETLFDNPRYTTTDNPMTYTFSGLTAGNYKVRIYCGEYTLTNTIGSRYFDISINSVLVADDFDMVATFGGVGIAGMVEYEVVVSGTTLAITWTPVVANTPVHGIELLLED